MAMVIHVAEASDGCEVAVLESDDGLLTVTEYDQLGQLVEISPMFDCQCRETAKAIANDIAEGEDWR